jgi:hypothetical protein
MEDARRDEMANGLLSVHNQGVAGIVSALKPDNQVGADVRRSTTFPFPSSPHWVPMTTTLDMKKFPFILKPVTRDRCPVSWGHWQSYWHVIKALPRIKNKPGCDVTGKPKDLLAETVNLVNGFIRSLLCLAGRTPMNGPRLAVP